MNFYVSRQYQRGGEAHFARFTDRSDAELFINMKRESDQLMKLSVIYRLYDGSRLIETFDDTGGSAWGAASGSRVDTSSRGQGAGTSFQPTPFNVAPRPSGMPQNWLKGEDKKSDDTK